MSKEKDSQGFVWLHEWSDNAENFDDAQLASFCRAMFAAAQGKEYTIPDDPLAQLAFKYANRDRERMQDFKNKQSKNGENGGAPKGNKNASKQPKNNPKTTEEQPKNNPKQTQRQRQYQSQLQEQLQKQPQEGGEGIAPAPDGFDFETYGIMENVKLKPSQYRHLVESYGEETTNQTLDELSCKLADGSTDSSNHYATLTYWLSYQRRTNGVPLTSKTTQPQLGGVSEAWKKLFPEYAKQMEEDLNGIHQ